MIEEFDESSLALKEGMKKGEEKNRKLKSENKALCEYVRRLMHPFREEDWTFVPPSSLLKESLDGLEEIRKMAQCSKESVEDVFTTTCKFIEDLA